jgi:hypothetical protein
VTCLPPDRLFPCQASTDQRERADSMEPVLAAEPIESSEATEPTEPIDKIDLLEPMLRMNPGERGAPSLLRVGSFSQPGRGPGS